MPVRDTSLDVYNRIKEDGVLSKRRLEVYLALFEHGPATSNELFRKMKGSIRVSQANIQPRLGELVQTGCVAELRERTCGVTGNTVIEYDVTSKYPLILKKRNKRIVRVDADQMAEDLFEAIFMGPMNQMKDRLDNVFRKHFKIQISSFFNRKSQPSQKRSEPGQISFDL